MEEAEAAEQQYEAQQDAGKDTVLVADDSELNREMLKEILGQSFNVVLVEDGARALETLENRRGEISAMLLDIVMPGMDGFEVLSVMNARGMIDDVPVLMISAETSSVYMERAYELGAVDYITRPFNALEVQHRVVNAVVVHGRQDRLVEMVVRQTANREREYTTLITVLAHVVEFRNGESGFHVIRINTIVEILMNALVRNYPEYRFTSHEISLIRTASSLHDIGKISIPEEILNKPGKLTAEEFEIMKTHSMIGADMLGDVKGYQDEPLLHYAYEICRWHHERWDGSGYPDGLVGDETPIYVQIVSVADVYDALVSKRVYKDAYSHETAMRMILNGECGAFNPILLDCLQSCAEEIDKSLHINSLGGQAEHQVEVAARGAFYDSMGVAEGSGSTMVTAMRKERMEYEEFAKLLGELWFQYYRDSRMLRFVPQETAQSMGLASVIYNPSEDARILNICGERLVDEVQEYLAAASQGTQDFRGQFELNIDGAAHYYSIVLHPRWQGEGEGHRIAGFIGVASDRYSEHVQMRRLENEAHRDGLTGLANLRCATEFAEAYIAKRDGVLLCCMLDVDNFKEINDSQGHLRGNELLKGFAGILRESVREGDLVARIGGDEFVLLLGLSADLNAIVGRIFQNIADRCKGIGLEVSMGVAASIDGDVDWVTLFGHADKALYFVKRKGRNGFAFYEKSMDDMFSEVSPIEDGGGHGPEGILRRGRRQL